MITRIIRCQLIAKEIDLLDYQSLVFKVLENNCPFGHSYCMVTVFPNWQSVIPEMEDIGYLEYDEVKGGEDTYYDKYLEDNVKYKYSNLIFKKFVKEVDNSKKDIII